MSSLDGIDRKTGGLPVPFMYVDFMTKLRRSSIECCPEKIINQGYTELQLAPEKGK
jgi:hypothetical protein